MKNTLLLIVCLIALVLMVTVTEGNPAAEDKSEGNIRIKSKFLTNLMYSLPFFCHFSVTTLLSKTDNGHVEAIQGLT